MNEVTELVPHGPHGTCQKCSREGELCPPLQNPPEYHGLCHGCAWLAWFEDAGKGWDDVECIACELGRTCEEHPDGGGE